MSNSAVNYNLLSLDPNSIKSSLITFLQQSNSAFQDYNFKGSNINTLLDVLSRNTFLNSFFVNMAFSELFLDSAQLRDSLVSKSKELNYVPYSVSSSTTSVNLAIQTANLQTFEIPMGTSFNGRNSNGTFTFVTDSNYINTSSNGYYTFSNVNIFEGFYTTDIFTVQNGNNQLFTLSNPDVDTSSIYVIVSEDAGNSNGLYISAQSLYGISGNSNVYFIQASSSNTYQFQFGDGVLGHQPQNGAVVSATYRVATGANANYVSTFNLNNNLGVYNGGSVTGVTITSNGPSTGGADRESADSIRFNAPRNYQTQQRAVTSQDYKTLILAQYPQIADAYVYGGGITANSVQFGSVFIALVTQAGNPATTSMKSDIVTYIKNLNILNIPVSIVDPGYLYIDVVSNVHVDFSQTKLTPAQYTSLTYNTISDFSNNNVGMFNTPFRLSKLSDAIDSSDPYILSNETTIKLKRYANITLNVNSPINLSFNNPVINLNSSQYVIGSNTYYITDAGNNGGILYQYQVLTSGKIANPTIVGNINYASGNFTISSLNISNYVNGGTGLYFVAPPLYNDIYCYNSDIIEIDTISGISVGIISD
jgi:hypothetical protein